jgi:chemotaxis response regulator CheB
MPDTHDQRRTQYHDIVVIGASAGGLQPLQRLLADLPADLPAAVFIVLHIGATSHLAEVLDRIATVPVLRAKSGQPIEPGRIYVAVPGVHLLLHDQHILLRRGPRENLVRPAIDPLFRSAACTFGGRVIGVVLSGALNDGTAGLRAIKQCGGLAVVQQPNDAAVPDMPLSALAYAEIDHVAPVSRLGGLLARLVRQPAGETPTIRSRSGWKRRSPHRSCRAWKPTRDLARRPVSPARNVTVPSGRLLTATCSATDAMSATLLPPTPSCKRSPSRQRRCSGA